MTAECIVNALLEGPPRPQPIPVRIRQADGSMIDAEFSGYYEWPGRGYIPSIGYVHSEGGHTHGPLRRGDTLMSQVPNPQEWAELEKSQELTAPAKGCFWPTGGSLS